MKLKIVGKTGDFPFEMSPDEIKQLIETHDCSSYLKLTEYLFDGSGNICGLKGLADSGHGYGFNDGWKEFSIKIGQTYSFSHWYTSIDGPSDWSTGHFMVTLQLVESE